jgi:predicted phosphodiesterase
MMRYAVISDVHANKEALDAVLDKIDRESVDAILFLGDSVGYGPDPNECVEILKDRADIILAGNHDWAVVGMTDTRYFNPYARAAVEWTEVVLNDENRRFISSLPLTEKVGDILLVHATPAEPERWHYLLSPSDAILNFRYFKEKICFIGHSHAPYIMELSPEGKIIVHDRCADIKKASRYIINVGSVGQPRDGNPEAAFAVLRNNYIEIKRASYDIVSTQKKMYDAGLPVFLIERLSSGI